MFFIQLSVSQNTEINRRLRQHIFILHCETSGRKSEEWKVLKYLLRNIEEFIEKV